MSANEIISRFIESRHVSWRAIIDDQITPRFVVCFDEDGTEISWEQALRGSPGGKMGDVEYVTPTPGMGYYAHLRIAGGGGSTHGASTRYEIAAPDWKTLAHATEPAVGGEPDVVVEDFEATPGSVRFAEGLSAQL